VRNSHLLRGEHTHEHRPGYAASADDEAVRRLIDRPDGKERIIALDQCLVGIESAQAGFQSLCVVGRFRRRE
jgi:hypothetical protein